MTSREQQQQMRLVYYDDRPHGIALKMMLGVTVIAWIPHVPFIYSLYPLHYGIGDVLVVIETAVTVLG